jgi:hypothetical protein
LKILAKNISKNLNKFSSSEMAKTGKSSGVGESLMTEETLDLDSDEFNSSNKGPFQVKNVSKQDYLAQRKNFALLPLEYNDV